MTDHEKLLEVIEKLEKVEKLIIKSEPTDEEVAEAAKKWLCQIWKVAASAAKEENKDD